MQVLMAKLPFRRIQTSPFLCFCVVLVAVSWLGQSEAAFHFGINQQAYSNIVTVDPSGHGNFSTIQSAIDHVPSNNNKWILIKIAAGIFREKVKIPYDKPCIAMLGAGKRKTEVVWDDHESLPQSSTFAAMADNTIVKAITFTNSYNLPRKGKNTNPRVPAVAGMICGDKSVFFDVGFKGLQDTLWDCDGRHYFHQCTIQGAVDFIFGSGQSLYERCVIQVLGNELQPGLTGFITAQGRTNPYDANGFVFKGCLVYGTGKAYLGRPWREYARVIFYNCNLSDVIVPAGWDAWNSVGKEKQLTFAEHRCYGSGANMKGRVKWEKQLHGEAFNKVSGLDFIDRDGWTRNLPVYYRPKSIKTKNQS